MSPPPCRPSRGRVALGWAAGVFVGAQLAAGVLFDYAWPQVRYPFFHAQLGRVAGLVPPPNVVFLGSSRTGHAVLEEEVSAVARAVSGDAAVRCVNAHALSGDPVVQERMLDGLLRRGVRPRLVVIEVAPETLNHRNRWVAVYGPWLLCWHDLPTFAPEVAQSGSGLARVAGARLLPLHVYREQIRARVAGQARRAEPAAPPSPAADMPPTAGDAAAVWRARIAAGLRAAPPGANPATAINLQGLDRELEDYRPGGTRSAALERMLACCRDRGIEPILLCPPLSTAHRGAYTPAVEAAFRAYLGRLARQYVCRCVDYRDALPDTLLLDHHYANPAGAALFSQRLSLEVIAPAWAGSGGG